MNHVPNATSNGKPGESTHSPSGVYWALLNSLSVADREHIGDAIARHRRPAPAAATAPSLTDPRNP
ncbi:MAG: hypothetical protein QOI76_675 [Frankiales bacterium]|nr:hypothetical protein [Frankiales bacterium]